MPHAERPSTSVSRHPSPSVTGERRRVLVALALLPAGVLASTLTGVARPAAADQIADAKAQAAAITARIGAAQARIQALTGQVNQADYQLSQLQTQISADQAAIAKDQGTVDKDRTELRSEAISDYTNSGNGSQATQIFSSNLNTNGIRSEYTSIATGNVSTTIDHLHTAQTELQTTQAALQQQSAQASATRNSLVGEQQQATALAAQDQQTLAGVNANIQHLIQQQQAAAAAAAARAFQAKVAAAAAAAQARAAAPTRSVAGPSSTPSTSGGGGSSTTVPVSAGPLPPLAPGAAGAVQAAEREVGVPYVWGGASPSGFDCSGLVMWAYAQVGISLPHYSGGQYADTTHIPLSAIQPGDLLFYGPGGSQHVAMYVGGGSMIEAPYTGASVWITGVRTGGDFAGVGRVT
jgi:cell wall-associated NlpC family hydrolase